MCFSTISIAWLGQSVLIFLGTLKTTLLDRPNRKCIYANLLKAFQKNGFHILMHLKDKKKLHSF